MKPSERIAQIAAERIKNDPTVASILSQNLFGEPLGSANELDVIAYLDEVAGNIYRDTEERMRRDPEFNGAVKLMMSVAQQHGFTPGELKQIAFRAAYELEIRRSTWAVPIAEGAVK